jgi:hypothetical protein
LPEEAPREAASVNVRFPPTPASNDQNQTQATIVRGMLPGSIQPTKMGGAFAPLLPRLLWILLELFRNVEGRVRRAINVGRCANCRIDDQVQGIK